MFIYYYVIVTYMVVRLIYDFEDDPRECKAHKKMVKNLENMLLKNPDQIKEYIPAFIGEAELMRVMAEDDVTNKTSDGDIVFRDTATGKLFVIECKTYDADPTFVEWQTRPLTGALKRKYGVGVNAYYAKIRDEELDIRFMYDR